MLFSIGKYISSGDFSMLFVQLAAMFFVVFCTTPVHEFAHAWMAVKLGDDTPRLAGRLTLRPMAHIDPMGAIMIFLLGFGYAKPVQVNIHNLKNGRKSFALVAVAGPVSNLLMALVFLFFRAIVDCGAAVLPKAVYMVLAYFFYFAASINITLAVFNLIPVPPLDGSRILGLLIPQKYYYTIMRYERYIMIGMFLLLWSRVLTVPLSFLSDLVFSGLDLVARLPFKLSGLLR